MIGLWRGLSVTVCFAIANASQANLPVSRELDVPRGKSTTLSVASESDVKVCETAFEVPTDGQIVFRSLIFGSWFPPSGVALCKVDRDGYLVLGMSDAAKAGGRGAISLETPLALRILALFHSELERPRAPESPELFIDVDTIVWVGSRTGLPKRTGATLNCIDRDTRLGRMIELAAALCWFRDCSADEQVRTTNRLDQIVTELEVALKFENRPANP